MISVIITSLKEPKTIGKAIASIADKKYSQIPEDFEIIQVSPDRETLEAGSRTAKKLHIKNFFQIKDPMKGKPTDLKLAFERAHGDILILTDGDVYFGKNAVKHLLTAFKDEYIGGVSGRAVSTNKKNNFMGYIGHLQVDAADHKRKKEMPYSSDLKLHVSKDSFFPMSGYIMAVRKNLVNIHPEALADDAYISYFIREKGFNIAYAPQAKCYIKTPNSIKDYIKQKTRSIGGFVQLKQLDVIKKEKQKRGFLHEVRYTGFALFQYPSSIKEFVWSILLHFLRLYTWFVIWYKQVIKKEGMPKTGWERIESTK